MRRAPSWSDRSTISVSSNRVHDGFGVARLLWGRRAEFGLEFGDVLVEVLESLGSFDHRTHGDLQQLRSRKSAILDLAIQIIGEIDLKAWHTPDYTPMRMT